MATAVKWGTYRWRCDESGQSHKFCSQSRNYTSEPLNVKVSIRKLYCLFYLFYYCISGRCESLWKSGIKPGTFLLKDLVTFSEKWIQCMRRMKEGRKVEADGLHVDMRETAEKKKSISWWNLHIKVSERVALLCHRRLCNDTKLPKKVWSDWEKLESTNTFIYNQQTHHLFVFKNHFVTSQASR